MNNLASCEGLGVVTKTKKLDADKTVAGSWQGEEAGAGLALPHRLPPLLQRGGAAWPTEPDQAEEAEQGEKIHSAMLDFPPLL